MNPLDNPIWSALSTDQLSIALGDERARRYPPAIGPLSGMPGVRDENYDALRALTCAGSSVALFCLEPPPSAAGWTLVRDGQLHQMICAQNQCPPEEMPLLHGELRRLTASDAPAMVHLARLTEPGPFRDRTLELGTFYGIFHAGQLVAMAGQRMRLPGFIEVSGVCTHPEARGRGYACRLMSLVMRDIAQEDRTPFLHVMTDNPAIRLYETLGFSVRRTFHLSVLQNPG